MPELRVQIVAVMFFGLLGVAAGQEPPPDDADRAARLKEAEAHLGDLKMTLAGKDEELRPIDRPLLIYGDTARSNADGTLWAWGPTGRPLVLMETYRNTYAQKNRVNAITLTSTERVVLKTPQGQSWQPEKTQIELKALPGAAAPEARETGRLRQLREQARRFTAHEFWDPDNSRFELRLLAQPVHRYSAEKTGLLDGAVFVLANGTNPEVILLIEAVAASGNSPARWQYALARLGSAEMHVSIDGTEIWKQDRTPGVVGQPTDPYWIFITPRPATP
jgi:hypothetical protein